MRKISTENMIALATNGKGELARLVAGCIEAGVVVPSQLTAALKKAGNNVAYYSGPEDDAPEGDHPHGAWVRVTKNGVIVARAYSADKADALLQAVYAALQEESAAAKKKA